MATTPGENAMPRSVIVMLVIEVSRRLEAMAQAIADGHAAKRNYQRPRIEDILDSLEASADAHAGDANTVYRTVRRMTILAVVQNDPNRCKQAIALLHRIADSAPSSR